MKGFKAKAWAFKAKAKKNWPSGLTSLAGMVLFKLKFIFGRVKYWCFCRKFTDNCWRKSHITQQGIGFEFEAGQG